MLMLVPKFLPIQGTWPWYFWKPPHCPRLALIEGLGLGSDHVMGDRARVRQFVESARSSTPHDDGMTWAARWVLGQSNQCPGTRLSWVPGVSPTAQVIHAEHVYALGRLARAAALRSDIPGTDEVHALEGVIAVLGGVLSDRPSNQ